MTEIIKDKMSAFYTGLYLTGINRVAFHNGAGFCYLDLSAVVTVKKPEQKDNMPPVMNGFSDLMVEVFGHRGQHARAAMGAYVLEGNMPVCVDAIIKVRR